MGDNQNKLSSFSKWIMRVLLIGMVIFFVLIFVTSFSPLWIGIFQFCGCCVLLILASINTFPFCKTRRTRKHLSERFTFLFLALTVASIGVKNILEFTGFMGFNYGLCLNILGISSLVLSIIFLILTAIIISKDSKVNAIQ